MNLVVPKLAQKSSTSSPQGFLRPNPSQNTEVEAPRDRLAHSYTPDELEKRLLKLRTQARRDGAGLSRAKAATIIVNALGSSTCLA